MYIYVRIKNKMVYKYIFFINVYLYIYKNRWNVGIIKKWLSVAVYTFQQLKKLVGIYKMCRGCKNLKYIIFCRPPPPFMRKNTEVLTTY